MNQAEEKYDLIIVVADNDAYGVIESLITKRQKSLGIKQSIRYKIIKHPQKDPGVFNTTSDLIRNYIKQAKFCLVLLDYEGSGAEDKMSANDVCVHIEEDLEKNGWKGRHKAIVFDPELEIWIWQKSKSICQAIGWKDSPDDLYQWLENNNFKFDDSNKPLRPKEALEDILRNAVGRPFSGAIHKEIAEKASTKSCRDRAFQVFSATLQSWFAE